MEELLVYALLLFEDIMSEDEYKKRLDKLFLHSPENEDLLYLEWEMDIKKSITYITSYIDYKVVDYELFGRILMKELNAYYKGHTDIKSFACKMYNLWGNLPRHIQEKEPFWALCYADDPLSWGDEEQTRDLYENMMNYYKD